VQDVIPSKGKEPLRLSWKLPSRLRKPITHQLKKERARKRAHNAIVRFERKAISTPKVWKKEVKKIAQEALPKIQLPTRHFFHKNIEQHTGDVYREELPKVKITLPPYAGSAAFSSSSVKKVAKKYTQPKKGSSIIRTKPARSASAPLVIPKKTTKTDAMNMPVSAFQERDVFYEFAHEDHEVHNPEESASVAPKVSIPFSVSVLRFAPARNVLTSIVFLLVGCAALTFFVWNLQGAGRGTAALTSIEGRAANAFKEVALAQDALANTDVKASEASFTAAFQELSAAQQELDKALSASKHSLQLIDVTGTVRAGEDMLSVGADLATAGQHMSRGVQPFLQIEGGKTLTDAIITSRPELAAAQEKIQHASETLSGVSETALPGELATHVGQLKEIIPRANDALSHLLNESTTFLYLLGAERDRQYLFLFANSDEIRPVGGFIGTVGLVNVSRGKVENIDVRSVYDGDGQLKALLAPPNPLLPIVSRWYLRDSNWFVDYSQSAKKAAQLFEKEGGPTVDGVVLLTPSVIKNLLTVTGPITVPGYDQAVTAENFVTVTQGEVTYNYDKTVNKPKQFLSDLTPILLTKLFAAPSGEENPKGKIATLGALTKSLKEKDIVLYFTNEQAQEEIVRLGWAGTLPQNVPGFLMVNNANIGGHKSDQFMEQEIDYRAQILEQGDVDVVVTVRRTHKGPQEKIEYPYPTGENPAYKINTVYQRLLVPKGAILLESKGFTPESNVPQPILSSGDIPLAADPDVTDWQLSQHRAPNGTVIGSEAGYTFFANWIVTKPAETTVTLTHYRIPNAVTMPSILKNASSYSLGIANQSGQKRTTLRASIQVPDTMKIVHVVPQSGVTRESDTSVVYRGELTSDVVPGIVFERK
jgi:hypothetical protein